MRDIAWAAGFLEGEGSFCGRAGCERISAVQVNQEPIQRLVALFGGRVRQYKRNHPNWKPVWNWYASGTRARGIMMTLYPLMSHKRRATIAGALALNAI